MYFNTPRWTNIKPNINKRNNLSTRGNARATIVIGDRTVFQPVDVCDIPKQYFNFIRNEDLKEKSEQIEFLIDYLCRIENCSTIMKRKDNNLLKMWVIDESKKVIEITLWENIAYTYANVVAPGKVVAVSSLKITKFQDNLQLESTSATTIDVDLAIEGYTDNIKRLKDIPKKDKLQLESTSATTVEMKPPVEDYKESMQKLKRMPKAQTIVYGQQTDKDIRNNITTLENVVSMNPDSTDICMQSSSQRISWLQKRYRRKCPNSGCDDTLRPEEDYLLCKHCGRIDNPVYTYCVNGTLDDGTTTLAVVFFDDAMTHAIGIDCETMVLKNGYEDPKVVPNPILSLAGQEKIYSFSMHKNKDASIQKTLEVDSATGMQEVEDISHRLIATAPATPAVKISRKQARDDPETQESSTQEYSRRKKAKNVISE
ncbi:hypothetical protein SSX86_019168 [Deinandra increscens subsp. villosa]|uniref:Replication protein A OB domain-containing protein n=1 Tax=Deinandra increscens subsp. villosa TaxID=3103831 RepID=A0AAP0CS99_9ASTR